MKVICSGMPKTGTKSLAAALRILGYTVYDIEEQYLYLSNSLIEVIEKGWTTEKIKTMFKNVDAVTDMPSNILWEEIFQAFPDVKVVHTERPTAELWGESASQQISSIGGSTVARILANITPTGRKFRKFLCCCARVAFNMGDLSLLSAAIPFNRQMAMLKYREHNSRVKQIVPSDQLLLFDMSDGWKPLCKFLGESVPDVDFPHRNKGASITAEIIDKSLIYEQIRKECLILLSFLFAAISLLLYLLLS